MQQTSQGPAGKLSLRPLGDRILVRQESYKDQLASGLYIPQGSREGFEDKGTVVAVGSRVDDIKAGDRVLFKRRADTALVPDVREGDPNGWKDLLMLQPDDILAILED